MKVAEILLVEDSPSDIRLTQEALKDSKLINNLHVVEDGVEAMDFLCQRPPYAHAPRPDLILLDLNLPKKSGFEVLQEIKSHPSLMRIPVVILTTSDDEQDIFKTYNLHANCYVSKPLTMAQFIIIVRQIEDFWFGIVKLPS